MIKTNLLNYNYLPVIALTLISVILVGFINPMVLLFAFALFLILAIIKNFRIGTFLIIIFSFTNYAGQQVFESLHIMLLITIITSFAFALTFLRGNADFRNAEKFDVLILLFALWSLISGIIAFDHKMWYQNIEWLLRSIIVFYLVVNSISAVKEIFIIFKLIVLSIFLSSFIAFFAEYGIVSFTFSTLISLFTKRFAGSIFDPNYFSMTVAASLPLAAVIILKEKLLILKVFWLFATLFLLFSIVISQSRTGLLSVAVVLLYTIYHFISNRRREIFLILVPLALILIFLPSFFWHRVWLFISAITTGSRGDISTIQRFTLLSSAFDIFIKHPFFGVGLGNFEYYAARYIQYPMVCHNTYLEIAANLGLPGLIIFLTILYRTYASLRTEEQAKEHLELIWGVKAGFLGICTAILFLSVPFKLDLWVFLGLTAVIKRLLGEQDVE